MIQPIDLQDERVFGYRVDGEVTVDDLKPLMDQLEDKTRKHAKMRVYVEYIQIDAISLRAVWEDLKFDIKHLTDFEKAAVVTDKNWVGVSAITANLIPGLEVKFFKFAEEQQARAWVRN